MSFSPARRFCVFLSECIVGTMLVAVTPVAAQQQETGDEPVSVILQDLFLAETVYPQGQYELQTTTGMQWAHGETQEALSTSLLTELGLTDRFQLLTRLPVEYVNIDGATNVSGVGRPSVGAKYTAYSSRRQGLAFAFGAAVLFPALSSDMGADAYSYEPFVIGYKVFGPTAINVVGALEIEQPHEPGAETEVGAKTSIALLIPREYLTPTLEVAVEIGHGHPAVRVAPGLSFEAPLHLEFGLAAAIGITDTAPDLSVLFHVTREWGLASGHGGKRAKKAE